MVNIVTKLLFMGDLIVQKRSNISSFTLFTGFTEANWHK